MTVICYESCVKEYDRSNSIANGDCSIASAIFSILNPFSYNDFATFCLPSKYPSFHAKLIVAAQSQ